jgi:hypothetical protein
LKNKPGEGNDPSGSKGERSSVSRNWGVHRGRGGAARLGAREAKLAQGGHGGQASPDAAARSRGVDTPLSSLPATNTAHSLGVGQE